MPLRGDANDVDVASSAIRDSELTGTCNLTLDRFYIKSGNRSTNVSTIVIPTYLQIDIIQAISSVDLTNKSVFTMKL